MSALARRPRPHHEGENGVCAIKSRDEVSDRYSAFYRWTVRLAGNTHKAAHRLDGDVERALLGIRSGLSVTRDGAIDDARIQFFHAQIINSKPTHDTGTEVLN